MASPAKVVGFRRGVNIYSSAGTIRAFGGRQNISGAQYDDIKGLAETLEALKKFDVSLERKGREELKKAAIIGELVAKAETPREGQVPSGFAYINQTGAEWYGTRGTAKARAFPRYNRDDARASIKTTTRADRKERFVRERRYGFVNIVGIEMTDPAAAIIAGAGTMSAGQSEKGRRFINVIAERTGIKRPLYRILLPAVIKTRPYVMASLKMVADEQMAIVGRISRRHD